MTEVIGILEKAWEGNTGANADEYEDFNAGYLVCTSSVS